MTLLQGIEKWVSHGGSVCVECNETSHGGQFYLMFKWKDHREAATGFIWDRRNNDTVDDLEAYWQQLLATGNLEKTRELAKHGRGA